MVITSSLKFPGVNGEQISIIEDDDGVLLSEFPLNSSPYSQSVSTKLSSSDIILFNSGAKVIDSSSSINNKKKSILWLNECEMYMYVKLCF